jgi:hypothetical protein
MLAVLLRGGSAPALALQHQLQLLQLLQLLLMLMQGRAVAQQLLALTLAQTGQLM